MHISGIYALNNKIWSRKLVYIQEHMHIHFSRPMWNGIGNEESRINNSKVYSHVNNNSTLKNLEI